jgi:hypothetical protein
MNQAAAVIDLEELRRRRAARSAPRPPVPAAARPAPMLVPMCVVWVPVWTLA